VSEEYFAPARAKREELESDLDTVRDILAEGAKRAREVAASVVDRARRNCGLR